MKKEKNSYFAHKTKIKLIKLYEILLKKTDCDNVMTTAQILMELKKENIDIDRRVLAKDIQTLISAGYDIGICKEKHSNAYYLKQERWCSADSRMVVDAIQAARFITEEQTKLLIEKVKKRLCPSPESQPAELVRFNSRKSTNCEVYTNINALENALRKNKKVSFLYFDLNENHERRYRKDEERYVVEPIALIYQDDYYYVMTWNSKYSDVTNYRIDRIADIKIETAEICKTAEMVAKEKKALCFTREAFNMYGGVKKSHTIEFEDSLLGPVYDKFGEDIPISRNQNNLCEAEIEIRESPTWRGWIAQFEGKMRIVK